MNVRFVRVSAVVLAAVAIVVGGCGLRFGDGARTVDGSGPVREEERTVADVRAVTVTNEGDLTVRLGDTQELVVEAQEGLLAYIETDVDGGTLTIGTRDGYDLDPSEPIRYRMTVRTLEALTTTSSGRIETSGLTVDSLEVGVTSSGGVAIEKLDADGLVVRISSSGDVSVGGGYVDAQEVRLTSSGSYEARDLSSSRADVELTSSGDASIRVSDRLEARLTSSGDLHCIGTPEVDAETTSSGKVVLDTGS